VVNEIHRKNHFLLLGCQPWREPQEPNYSNSACIKSAAHSPPPGQPVTLLPQEAITKVSYRLYTQ